MDIQKQFYKAIKNNNIDNVKLLLKNKKVDPSRMSNWAIQQASDNKHFNIINLLWKDKRVKNSLEDSNKDLYNKLITQNNIGQF